MPRKIALTILFALLLSLGFSSDSLRKGGVTKQFTAYSITESLLRNGYAPLSSSVPCPGNVSWVEEPPVFHEVAALGISFFNAPPALVPVLFYLLLVFSMVSLIEWLLPNPPLWALLAAALAPGFLRNSIQHMPDLPGAALLAAGAALIARRKRTLGLAALVLSVTAKALTGPAAVAILFWDEFLADARAGSAPKLSGVNSWLQFVARSVVLAVPFFVWILLIERTGTSSPFHFTQGVMENRHSGGWEILADPGYYRRVFNWLAIQGAGLALFVPAVVGIWRTARTRRTWREHPRDLLLPLWAVAVVPFMIVVRRGNWLHDYYVLSFMIPFALMGALQLADLAKKPKWKWPVRALFLVAIANGIFSLARLEPVSIGPHEVRPIFCDIEDFKN